MLTNAIMPPVRLSEKDFQDDDGSRWARYQKYLDFYKGLQWDSSIPDRQGQRRLVVNYARTFIKKGASYLLGTGVKYECNNLEAEKALAEIASRNNFDLLDYDTALDAAVLGDGGWKITRQPCTSGVTVRQVDPCFISATWAGDDTATLRSVTEAYKLDALEASHRFNLAIAGEQIGKQVTVYEHWTDQHLEIKVGDTTISRANPYGFIPYVLFPNERRPKLFWGDSDLVDIIELCSELNVRLSVMAQILQYSGNPVLVLENVEGSTNLRVGPGAVWELPENSRAYLLELMKEGGLTAHSEYITLLHQTIFDLAEMPRVAFARDMVSGNQASGVALELMLNPVVQKVRRKRAIWNKALEQRARLALRLMGFPKEIDIKINWPSVLPKDTATLVANEVTLVSAGVHSRETANRNLGEESPEREVDLAFNEAREWASLSVRNANNTSGQGAPRPVSGALVQGLARAAGGD